MVNGRIPLNNQRVNDFKDLSPLDGIKFAYDLCVEEKLNREMIFYNRYWLLAMSVDCCQLSVEIRGKPNDSRELSFHSVYSFTCKSSKSPGYVRKIPPGPDLALIRCGSG